MKIVLVILVVISSSVVGKNIQLKYKNKVNIYKNLIKFADFTILKIQSFNDGLDNIFDEYISNCDNKLVSDYFIIKSIIFSSRKLEYDDMKKLKICQNLKGNEINDIMNFINLLGKNDIKSQLSSIKGYREIFKNKLYDAEKDLKQNGDLIYKVSICAGVALSILLL